MNGQRRSHRLIGNCAGAIDLAGIAACAECRDFFAIHRSRFSRTDSWHGNFVGRARCRLHGPLPLATGVYPSLSVLGSTVRITRFQRSTQRVNQPHLAAAITERQVRL